MQLNHFADPFQNGHASVDQFFSESNSLTEQYNPGYGANNGFGFAQNAAGYEWGDHQGQLSGGMGGGDTHYHSHDKLYDASAYGHRHDAMNGGIGSGGGMCGADPQSLERANLQWEGHMTHNNGMGSGQHLQQRGGQQPPQAEEVSMPEYVYQGPDDLEFDDEEVAPKKGMAYWKKRTSTLIINGLSVAVWIWLWSNMGFSKLLVGNAGNVLYWGFIAVMAWGVFQSDHRSGRYDEEREVLGSVESNLRTLVKLTAGAATLLLSFKLMKGKSAATQYAVNSALAIAFFLSLGGLLNITSKKRGEVVRRYRKVKAAALNLSIGLMAVAALLVLGVGNNGSFAIQSGGGGGGGGKEKRAPIEIEQPVKIKRTYSYEDVVSPSMAAGVAQQQMGGGGYDMGGYDAAGGAMAGYGAQGYGTGYQVSGGGGDSGLGGMSPTVLQGGGGMTSDYAMMANTAPVAPTVLQ